MKNQFMAEFAAMKQNQLELEKMLREQQNELASLREVLAQKSANRPDITVPANLPAPVQLKTADTSRRKMLKRMGLAVLAGGAALGITAATYAPVEAKISVNPSQNVGAVITRNGASIINIPPIPNFGLLVSSDNSFNASTVLTGVSGFDVGVIGNSSATNGIGMIGFGSATSGIGVQGYALSGTGVNGQSISGTGVVGTSTDGKGVYGTSFSGTGVYGTSSNEIGVYGETFTATIPAIVAQNSDPNSARGIALQILKGGLTVAGAGIGTSTAAFIHQTTAANIGGNNSLIDNPLCNDRPDALLFVTHNYNPPNATPTHEAISFGVSYSTSDGKGYWFIILESATDPQPTMPAGLYFNVLIINP